MKKNLLIFLSIVLLFCLFCSCSTTSSYIMTPEETLSQEGYAILFNTTNKDYSFKVDSGSLSKIGTIDNHSALTMKRIAKGAEIKIYDTVSGEWLPYQIPALEILSTTDETILATVPVLSLDNGSITLEDTWKQFLSREGKLDESEGEIYSIFNGESWILTNDMNRPIASSSSSLGVSGLGLVAIVCALAGLGGLIFMVAYAGH